MSKRYKREHGRILSVETQTRGSALDADAAAAATSITVTDAGDFDEDGGWLIIGGQVVEFTDVDDDAGVIALATPLAAAAEQGDPVHVWSDLYAETVDYQVALVELDGEYDNPDPVVAEVAEGVGDLPEGDRGAAGESCTLLRVADDEWEVVGVGGRSRKSRGVRWEQDDSYELTAGDVTAGSVTMPLSHRPCDEALTCVLAGVPQPPTEYVVDYDGQTLTMPLDGWEQAGDMLWVHYAYRKGVTTPSVSGDLVLVGTTHIKSPPTDTTSIALPPGTQAGDFLVVVADTNYSASMSDARMTPRLIGGGGFAGGVWSGFADESGDPVGLSLVCNGSFRYGAAILAAFRGPTSVVDVETVEGVAEPTLPSVTASFAVAAAYSAYSATDGEMQLLDADGWVDAYGTGLGKASARIAYWTGAAPSSQPVWANAQDGNPERVGVAVIGVS